MPFQSEKQRRYLWANEPEIARDWTDTYGSRIHKYDGGIARLGLKLGGSPLSWILRLLLNQGDEDDPNWFQTKAQNITGGIGNFGRTMQGGIGNFANTMRGGLTQGAYERARQNRINMQRQRNIINTLQSGKYAPGWETTAFERVQDLGKNLNLVDAGESSPVSIKKHIPSGPSHHPHGNGGGGYSHPGSAASRASSDPFNRGGLAGLWPR